MSGTCKIFGREERFSWSSNFTPPYSCERSLHERIVKNARSPHDAHGVEGVLASPSLRLHYRYIRV